MGKGGGGGGPSSQTVTQTNLPEYAKPYFQNLLNRTQAESYREYTPYEAERIAGFTPGEQALQTEISEMGTPSQFGQATRLAQGAAEAAGRAAQYTPGKFSASQIGGTDQVGTQDIQAAQTDYAPNLNYFQMAAPQLFNQATAQQYMSPYMQEVVNMQQREALREAQMAQNLVDLGAARQGTYGGARQLLGQTEAARNLSTKLGDIQARGLQSSFENAQAQFERDRAAGMAAQQANLQAALGVQELGSQQGLQTALANLSNQQQARVQNEANRLQAAGMNQEAALRTALANQQASLEAQKMAEQSRQFAGDLGLRGAAQAGQMAGLIGDLGTATQQADLQRLQAQSASEAQVRAMEQQELDQDYADFLRQRDYPMEQLGYFSNILRGLPIQLGSTATTYAQPPSMASQLGGAGLGALGLYNLLGK